MADQIEEGGVASSSLRESGESGALQSAEVSLLCAIIREDREAARAEREAAAERARAEREAVAERARVDHEATAAEHLRLMIEIFELKLQLGQGNGNRSGNVGGQPWTSGLRGERRSRIASAARDGAIAGDEGIPISYGTTTMPMWKTGSSEFAETPPSTLHSEAPASSNGENK